jgi:VIT1/CCC1 family predicted Fe2+/Mn2+ transporter
MSTAKRDDRLARMHDILKEPIRQKILLQLGEHDHLSFNDLIRNLKIKDLKELSTQLKTLGNLITETKNTNYTSEQDISKKPDEQYKLTEKGQSILNEMLAFPELESDSYKEKLFGDTSKPKREPRWWKPYWITLFIATIIVGVSVPIFTHFPLEKAATYLALALIAEGIAYYGRVKQSITLNRIMYILLGVFIGGVLWIISAFFLSRIFTQGPNEDVAIVVSLAVCFGLGALIGDSIGRARHYKGPEQYQP